MSDAPIICGVDGSRGSLAAARLGAAMGRRLARRVDFVHVAVPAEERYQREKSAAAQAELAKSVGAHAVLRVTVGAVVVARADVVVGSALTSAGATPVAVEQSTAAPALLVSAASAVRR